MTVMLRKALWDLRWTAFWYAVGAASYSLLVASFYPTVRQQSETIAKLVATYPKGVLTALGFTDFTTFTGYMGAETLNLFWPIMGCVFATLGGASLVAKEVEDGTSEIWLSVPAQRWRLLLAKVVALGVGLLSAVLVYMLAIELSALMVAATVQLLGVLAMGVVMAAFVFVVAAYSSLLSSFVSSRGVAAGISFAITLASYTFWVIGGLADQWKQLKNVSFYTAYTPQKALESGSIDLVPVGSLLAISALCVLVALFQFQRRDAI